MCTSVLPELYTCSMFVCGAHGGHKKASNILELEGWAVSAAMWVPGFEKVCARVASNVNN